MTTMSRISKRDENVKKLGTSSESGLSGDAGPSPPAIPTSQVDNQNGDNFECSLNAPTPELERIIHKFIVDTKDLVDSSSEDVQLGGGPSSEHGSKQSPVRSADQDPCLPAADPGVAYEPSSADKFGSRPPLLSPLFSPIDPLQPTVTVKPQASSTLTLLDSSRAREGQVTEASVSRPSQPSIHDDASSTTAVAGPTAKRSRPASVQGLLPVCALDIDFLSAKPRAASAPLLPSFDSSPPQSQHALSAYEVKQNPTANVSSASSDRQKRKPTGSATNQDRNPFITHVELSGNVLDSSLAAPGSSTNRTFNSQSKQTLAEVVVPVMPSPLFESSAPTTFSATPQFPEMSETEKQEIMKIIETTIQKTGLLSAPKELIAQSRRQKRKRDKNIATSEHSSTTTASVTDSQEDPAPKPKRKRTAKPKKERPIVANPYPRTTTTPPDEVPQHQVQGIRTYNLPVPMPLVNPASTSPMNDSQSNGKFNLAPSLPVHGNAFSVNVVPTDASAFQDTQSTAYGSTPYSFNVPRNLGINHTQGNIPTAVNPARLAYNPDPMHLQRLLWQRAQIARQIQARRQAGFADQRYQVPRIPNAMSMPVTNESGWNPQVPSLPSQPLADAGLPYFFDTVQSTQGVSGQPRTQSNVYSQYQVPNFDHNVQSGPYHVQHPLFNQALTGPSHSLHTNVFHPPTLNAQPTQPVEYELPFPPIHFGRERQEEVDYMARPAARAPMQNYAHSFNPSFAMAPINQLHDDLTTKGQVPVATFSRIHPTLPGSFIGDELTKAT